MNKHKNKNEDNYALIVRALQKGYEKYPETWIRLYLNKENKLAHISYQEAKDILDSMHRDKLIELNHYASASELIKSREPTPIPKGMNLIDGDWPYAVFPFNYFSVGIEDKFNEITSLLGSPLFLLAIIPKDRKYRYLFKMAKILIESGTDTEVENYRLALCFDSRLSKHQYENNKITKAKYNALIENRLKTLRKLLKPKEFTIKYNKKTSRLVKISPR